MMHIESMKDKTKGKKIIPLKAPHLLHVPLPELFGNKPEPVVETGERVKKYQVIGQAKEGFPAKVHSPVSGIVKKIGNILQADGKDGLCITIENDYQEEIDETQEKELVPKGYTSEELLRIVKDAGIVGEGGARFPTAVKYDVADKEIKTFFVNSAECEPYLTADYIIMKEKTAEFFEGIYLANLILKAKEVVIGIERQNKELEDIFAPFFKQEKYKDYKLEIVPDEYTQGGQLQLIDTIKGIEIPDDASSADYGYIMSNTGTVYAIYEAVVKHKPLIERIVTVSGEKSDNYGNYRIKIGTPVGHILDTIEYTKKDPMIIMGGPMMGKYIYDLDTPIHKGAGGVLMLKKENIERLSCIGCGYCVDVCPMYLMPMKYEEHYRKKKYHKLKKYSIDDCIDCGSCEYICPCNVPLMESIFKGKSKLKELENEAG